MPRRHSFTAQVSESNDDQTIRELFTNKLCAQMEVLGETQRSGYQMHHFASGMD
jgi:hypothetical protein